jgi:glycosyltransferase involved in cell wall biosynthesis
LKSAKPRLSVIVPAYQGGKVLPLSLSALGRSDLPRAHWELVVVDDASSDDTAIVAARYADTVVRLPGKPRGPAFGRNRGFEAARGEIVVFVDADVCVHPETLSRFLAIFDGNPAVSAVFGSYDASPSHTGVVSSFRNLLHHHVHHRDAGEAETFWAGCGAVRAEAFHEVGMFDEWHYARPQIEDVELGRRLRLRGHRILLRPEIQGTHLKRWTFKDILSTDFKHRGVPWTMMLLQEGPNPAGRALNLRTSEKLCTAAAGFGWLSIGSALLLRSALPLTVLALALLVVAFLNRDFYRFVARERGLGVTIAMFPLHVLYYATNVLSAMFGWLLHMLLGEPLPPIVATAEVGMDLRTWPPRPSQPSDNLWSQPAGTLSQRTPGKPPVEPAAEAVADAAPSRP